MVYKQARWEKQYEKFKATNKEEIIKKMAQIQRELAALKEGSEYGDKKAELGGLKKQLSDYERIEKNVGKIENILAFKKQLINKTLRLLDEKEKFDKDNSEIKRIISEINKLDEARKKLVEKVVELEAKLQDKNLAPKDKEKIQAEHQTLLSGIQENDLKFSHLAQSRDARKNALKSFDSNKIDEELLKNECLLGQCDLIGANLVKGKGKDEISAKLTQFKFNPDKDFAKKIKAMRAIQKVKDHEHANNDIFDQVDRVFQGQDRSEMGDRPGKDQSVAKLSEFDQKHPRWARFKNFFKNAYNNITGKNTRKAEDRAEKPSETPDKKPEEKTAIDDFDYAMEHLTGKDDEKVLMEIAEKGMSGYKKSWELEKHAKFELMQKQAAERLAKKYGGRYSEQDGMGEKKEGDRDDR